jgi:ABC-type dipeptide/oligopeptide/nickel transport system permease component
VESVLNLDVFAILGVVLFASLTVQLGNLLADIAVGRLDPRVRI